MKILLKNSDFYLGFLFQDENWTSGVFSLNVLTISIASKIIFSQKFETAHTLQTGFSLVVLIYFFLQS